MVDFFSYKGSRYVSSHQLYIALNKPPRQYYRWIRYNLTSNVTIKNNVDYRRNIYYRDHLSYAGTKDFLLRRHVAIALCMMTRSMRAKEVKLFLMTNFLEK